MTDDPKWPRASAWLAGDHETPPTATMQLLGVPMRLGSISGGNFDVAPGAIRDAEARFSTFDGELGIDVREVAVEDAGDVDLGELGPDQAFDAIRRSIAVGLEEMDAEAILGGDNSITHGGVHGLSLPLDRCGLLTLDAHHDLRDTTHGLTNGNPVRRLLEDGLPGTNIVQVGILPFANSKAYADLAKEAGISVVTADDARGRGVAPVVGEGLARLAERVDAIYVDLDVDVLDRAFAPACPGSRPGGLHPAEVQAAARACGAHPKVRAMDIVEVDPTRDVAEVTVLTAASFLLAFAAGLASRNGGD